MGVRALLLCVLAGWCGRVPAVDFQKLIDDAALSGGGRVVVPPGRHVTKGLFLKSGVELHLSEGAVLEGSADANDYFKMILPYSEGDWMAVVTAFGATNVSVTGKGEIFGNGTAWPIPASYANNQEGWRPRGLLFANCRDVRLEDFTLRDSACWGIVLKCCDGVVARRVTVDSHANFNNDGFDVEARNVLLEDCVADSGDDAFCIKSNDPGFVVENVVVRRCTGRSFCNHFKLGTASHGMMRNILFEQCCGESPKRDCDDRRPDRRGQKMFINARRNAYDKALTNLDVGFAHSAMAVENVDGGVVENVTFRDMVVEGSAAPLFVRGGTRMKRGCGIPPNDKYVFRNILFENVTGSWCSSIASSITGVEGCRVSNVTLRNVRLHGPGTGETAEERMCPVPDDRFGYPEMMMFDCILPAYGLYARHVDGLTLEDVSFVLDAGTFDRREAIVRDDVRD